MNPFMNMNFGIPQPNMNFNQDMYQQFRNMYNNIPQHNMDFNQNIYQQFMNQHGMNVYSQNGNIYQLFNMFLQWMNNYNLINNMNNLNNENNMNMMNFGNENNNNFSIEGRNNRNIFERENPEEEESQNLRNVLFVISGSGAKVNIEVPYYKTIAYLLNLFKRKLDIRENVLEKNIFFLYDAKKLELDGQRAIYELLRGNSSPIIVFDPLNILSH